MTDKSAASSGRNFESRLEQYGQDLWPDDWRQELLDQVRGNGGDMPLDADEVSVDPLALEPKTQPIAVGIPGLDRVVWWAIAAAVVVVLATSAVFLARSDQTRGDPAATTSSTTISNTSSSSVRQVGDDPGIDGPERLECGEVGIFGLRDLEGSFKWSVIKDDVPINDAAGTADFDVGGGVVQLIEPGRYKIIAEAEQFLYELLLDVGPEGECR